MGLSPAPKSLTVYNSTSDDCGKENPGKIYPNISHLAGSALHKKLYGLVTHGYKQPCKQRINLSLNHIFHPARQLHGQENAKDHILCKVSCLSHNKLAELHWQQAIKQP